MSLPCVTSLCGEPCHVSPFTADSCVGCFVVANVAVEFFFQFCVDRCFGTLRVELAGHLAANCFPHA